LAPYLSTTPPTSSVSGRVSSDAIDIASPTWTRVNGVTARKYSIDTGIHTPLPIASMPIAVTKRRCRPIGGNPSLESTRTSSELQCA
jgi:hypothetical protein